MPRLSFFIFFLSVALLRSQNSTIQTDQAVQNYGEVEHVYKLQSDFILKNTGAKNLYFLRADAGKHVKVWTSKKTVKPDDTVTVQLYYYPESVGRFSETVKMVTSADAKPYELSIKGEVKSIKKDDKTACYYFRRPNFPGNNNNKNNGMIVIAERPHKKNIDSLKSAQSGWNLDTANIFAEPVKDINPVAEVAPEKNLLPSSLERGKYKPNNIIFLVDISGSMSDTTKLRWMKLSLQKLFDNLREEDKISLVTYRDSVVCVAEGLNGADREKLKELVKGLKANGLTRGNKAIQFSLELALKNYIDGGNNQVILSTDGKFAFYEKDYKKWTETVGDKNIVLSTLAFGKDKEAMKNLKDISEKGKGSFIQVKSRKMAQSAIFDEVELRSRK